MTQPRLQKINLKLAGLLLALASATSLFGVPSGFIAQQVSGKDVTTAAARLQAPTGATHLVAGTPLTNYNCANTADEILEAFNLIVVPAYIRAQAILAANVTAGETNATTFNDNYQAMNDLAIALHWATDVLKNCDVNSSTGGLAPQPFNRGASASASLAGEFGGGSAWLAGAPSAAADIDAATDELAQMLDSGFRINSIALFTGSFDVQPAITPATPALAIPWFNDVAISSGTAKGYNVPDLGSTRNYPFQQAITNGDESLQFILQGLGATAGTVPVPPTHTSDTLAAAVKAGDQAQVRAAVTAGGVNVNAPDSSGETPLLNAVLRLDQDMVKLLMDLGADAGRAGRAGKSAREILKLQPVKQREHGLNVNYQDQASLNRFKAISKILQGR